MPPDAARSAPWLALDTATPLGSVALGWADRLLGEITLGIEVRHSEALLPALDFLLQRTGIQQDQLGRVVVGAGPGSFTGVRIAAATAKGLAHALGIPLYAYSSLAALAAPALHADQAVCAMFDARRDEVYAACYRFNAADDHIATLLPPSALAVDDVLDRFQAEPLYVGEGATRHAERIRARGATVAAPALAVPRASSLLWLADLLPQAGLVHDIAVWEPEYVRPPGAQRVAS
jgi:tRNA threonylcarbamoyladenosine biosynthesis protein TsaB